MNPAVLFVLLCGSLFCMNVYGEEKDSNGQLIIDKENIIGSTPPLDFSSPPTAFTPPVAAYCTYYGLDAVNCSHRFATFTSGPYTLTAHVYNQESKKGTCFLLHGYYDHSGLLVPLIQWCIAQGYAVATFDLPGHGLSSGEAAVIDSFFEYRTAIKDFAALCSGHLPKPCLAMGHSTGGAALFEYLFTSSQQYFSHIVFIAPLIRSEYWYLSQFAYLILSPFLSRTMRLNRKISSDKEFMKFMNNDPLRPDFFPVRWAKALYAWERKIRDYTPLSDISCTIIQGTKDNEVLWRYNIPFIQKKLPGCNSIMIEGARHQLINESTRYKREFFSHLEQIFNKIHDQ